MEKLLSALEGGAYENTLNMLYGSPDPGRAVHVAKAFAERFPASAGSPALYSAPGRTELGGNHTDHQHGHALCASADLDMLACAAPNGLDRIRVISDGYPAVELSLSALEPDAAEYGSTASLVRGVAAGIADRGYGLRGFDAYVHSNVIAGSGLSSSAAFEILIGTILNGLCCGGVLDAVELAKIGQRAENAFFGKPCGLLDQIGASVGGVVAIDFYDPAAPAVQRVDYDFAHSGHSLCIIDSGSTHADLTDDYAGIPAEMGAVAKLFGKTYLVELPETEFRAGISWARQSCGDRAVLRALHFYHDDGNAQAEAAALARGDFAEFLRIVNRSGLSSIENLQNIFSPAHPENQAEGLAISLGRELLDGAGAIRVHGGGFAGTVQAFVPNEKLEAFRSGIEAVFGRGKCHVLHIRPVGGCILLP